MGKIFNQPSPLKRSYISIAPPVGDSKIVEVKRDQGPGGMVGVSFVLENGLEIGIYMREADWHAVAAGIVATTKKNYMAAEDHGDPDLAPID